MPRFIYHIPLFLLLSCTTIAARAQAKLGQPAPELLIERFYNGDGQVMPDAEATQGKVVLLDFWATWCRPCIAGFPHMKELQATHRDDLLILGVTSDREGDLKAFLDRMKPGFTVAHDTDGSTFKQFGIRGLPTHVVINRKGRVVFHGRITDAQLAEVITTDTLVIPEKPKATRQAIPSSLIPGEDPLYQGIRKQAQLEAKELPQPQRLVFRPSLYPGFVGTAIRTYRPDSLVAYTVAGGTLADIFATLYDRSSSDWVRNATAFQDRFDLVYFRTGVTEEQAVADVSQAICQQLAAQLIQGKVRDSIWVLSMPVQSLHVVPASAARRGTQQLQIEVEELIEYLEFDTEERHMLDPALEGYAVQSSGFGWDELDEASGDTLIHLLERVGLVVRKEVRDVDILELRH